MSNLPNPDSNIKSAGARDLHQPQDPLPPPIRYSEALSDDITQQGVLGGGAASGQEKPLGVQPARQGGVALGGREIEDLPMGKANAGEKVMGKAEKVAGKMSKNPELYERGELREAGGKAAVTGQTQAPHD